jgi:hypothetical protein
MSRARNRNGQSSMMRGDLMEIDENGCFANVPEKTYKPRREPRNLASALEYLQKLLVTKNLSIQFKQIEVDGLRCIVMLEVLMIYGPDDEFIGSRQPTELEKRQLLS